MGNRAVIHWIIDGNRGVIAWVIEESKTGWVIDRLIEVLGIYQSG